MVTTKTFPKPNFGDGVPEDKGVKFDSDKVRVDLFPPDAFMAISQILTYGAKKYEEHNWEHGMKWGRVYGACLRHLMAWWGGRGNPTRVSFLFGELDDETGFSHLWHAGACIVFLISYEHRQIGEDDRWNH
jgi:hypothetical protein